MSASALKSSLAVLVTLVALGFTSTRAQDLVIYDDALQPPWQDWSWCTRDPNNSNPVHAGTKSFAVTLTNGWGGFSLWHGNFDSSPYASLSFWIHGGTSGGQRLQLYGELNGAGQPPVALPTPVAGTWTQVTVSLAALGVANSPDFSRFNIQDTSGAAAPTFYLDDLRLVAAANVPPAVTLTAPADTAVYITPAALTLSATVVTNGHTINKVSFYSGATLLAEDTTPPYTTTWNAVTPGSYNLLARVTYDGNATRDSALANVTVSTGTVTVDAQLNRHAISPLIYGVAFATTAQLSDLNSPLNRSGGNAETRYNWQLDCHNRANDWYYISIADGSGTPGESADNFVSSTRSGGAEPMLTISMIGSAPKLGSKRSKLASYSVGKYGAQTASEPGNPDAGNGVRAGDGALITWNDINDANFVTNSTFAQGWLTHLTNRWGVSTNGGVRYYFLDNEHSIWHSTHRDVHHDGAGRVEIRDKFFDYAGKVKAADPNALVLAPEEFGWSGYFNSGADLQYGDQHGWSYLPDRATNGNLDYVCWLLNECHQRDLATGQRLLDYFTLHRYTEDDAVGGNDVATTTQLKRNRWTRSFWDTNYVDESWIRFQSDNIVQLIPRMKTWVATYYPGTKTGITEYNWGAESHINGATTQADILGIFGREGLDLATRWGAPATGTPTYNAMKLYRNYDGNKSTFGDLSVSATGPNSDALAVYAAVRSSDNALTLVVINKQLDAAATPTITLTNFTPLGTARVWQLTSANTITRLSDLTLTGKTLSSTLPAQSITLFIVPGIGPATNPNPANGATGVAVNPTLSWSPGINATSNRLYFGTVSNAVAMATTNSPECKATLTNPSYTPGPLASSGRFYWRVDAMNGTNITPGPVWTFATVVDPTARLPVSAAFTNTTNFVLSFPGQFGQTYRVERTDSLNPPSWSTVTNNLPGTNGLIAILDPALPGHPQRFYRVLPLAP